MSAAGDLKRRTRTRRREMRRVDRRLRRQLHRRYWRCFWTWPLGHAYEAYVRDQRGHLVEVCVGCTKPRGPLNDSGGGGGGVVKVPNAPMEVS